MTELLHHTWGLRPKCCPQCGSPRFWCPAFVDMSTGEAVVDGTPIDLTPKEMHVLEALVRAYPRGVSKEALLSHVWPDRDGSSLTTRLMQQHIHRVRRKLQAKGVSATVRTVHGAGYALKFGDQA